MDIGQDHELLLSIPLVESLLASFQTQLLLKSPETKAILDNIQVFLKEGKPLSSEVDCRLSLALAALRKRLLIQDYASIEAELTAAQNQSLVFVKNYQEKL